jgi:glutathione S-transferase
MIRSEPVILWTATVTLLIGLFYFYTAFRVGNLRGKHEIRAPATTGHPEFDRAYRVQLNTLEQMGIVLPFLWVAAFYPIGWAWLAPLVGLVWVISRVLYLAGYMANPDKRLAGAMIGGICNLALFIIAALGVLRIWLMPHGT